MNNKRVIPVVYISSDYYMPYLYVSIFSIMMHANKDDFYKIVILSKDFSKRNLDILKKIENEYKNLDISIIYMEPIVKGYKFKSSKVFGFTDTGFYRLFIPRLFVQYHKVITIDADTIIKTDISALYDLISDNHTITGTIDYGLFSDYDFSEQRRNYTRNFVNSNPEKYIQAGVLGINIKRFNEKYKIDDMLRLSEEKEFMYYEQDVYNYFLEDDKCIIHPKWDLVFNEKEEMFISENTADFIKREYYEALNNPNIIHFAGNKPWNEPSSFLAIEFWEVAQKTVMYSLILNRLIESKLNHNLDNLKDEIIKKKYSLVSDNQRIRILKNKNLVFCGNKDKDLDFVKKLNVTATFLNISMNDNEINLFTCIKYMKEHILDNNIYVFLSNNYNNISNVLREENFVEYVDYVNCKEIFGY